MEQRILLADTRYVVRSGLRSFFSREFPDAFIEEATTDEAFVALITAYPYDMIVVSQSFLTKVSHPLKGSLIVLAAKPDKELFQVAREHHAKAYLGSDHTEDLLRAALSLVPGELLIDPTFSEGLVEQLGENSKQHIKLELLTDREREIAELLNQALLSEEIADRLCIAVSTVKRHVANIRSKLKRQ